MASDLNLSDLDDDKIAQAEAFLVSFLADQYPSLDLSEGRVLRNLLIRPAAIFHVLNQEDIDQLRQSMSMLAVEENPELATDEVVDAILSNYRITRDEGEKASGQVNIIIQELLTTSVQQGTVFTTNGLQYTNTQAFVGVTTQDAVVSDSQRLIVQRTDGLYSFVIPVEAAEVGDEYAIKRGSRFTASPTPAGVVDIQAAEDFQGGRDAETNQDLVDRFKLELSPKVFSGRIHIESLLRETVTDLKHTSIVGFGDQEMIRDRHNVFELSTGGKADLYTRTRNLPESITITKTATLINASEQLWQLSITRDDAPGFYLVERVLPENSAEEEGSHEITNETRALDLSQATNEYVPDVDTLIEGGYSRYQTAVVEFKDITTDVSGLTELSSTQDVRVDLLYMPDVATLQDLSIDRSSRNPNADYLVKAPVPAFTAVSVQIQYRDGAEVPDATAIKQAIVDRVQAQGFALGRLPASIIYDAAHNTIDSSGTLVTSPIDMACSIRKPGGSFIEIRSSNELVVPDLPLEGVTSRTVIFYLPLDSVDVSIEKVETLPV